jgi:hypothetical protein
MACTHPFEIDLIYDDQGNVIGGRCPSCGMVAFKSDGFWKSIWRGTQAFFGYVPPDLVHPREEEL